MRHATSKLSYRFAQGTLLLAVALGLGVITAGVAPEFEKIYASADVKITDAQRKAAEAFYRGKTIEWVSYTILGAVRRRCSES